MQLLVHVLHVCFVILSYLLNNMFCVFTEMCYRIINKEYRLTGRKLCKLWLESVLIIKIDDLLYK